MKVKKTKNKINLKKILKKNEKTKKVQKSIIGYEYSLKLAKIYSYRRNILVVLVAIILSIVFGYEIFKNSDRKKRNKNEGNDETNEKTSTNPIVSPITTVPPQNEKENDKDNQDTEPSIITAILSLLALLPPILNGGIEILRNSLQSIIQYAFINYGIPIFSILAVLGFALTVLINATINNIAAQPLVLGILGGLASIVILLYLFKKFGNRLFFKGVQIIGNEGDNEVIKLNLNTESVSSVIKDLTATDKGENKMNTTELITSTISNFDLFIKMLDKEKRIKLKNKVVVKVNTDRDINFQLTKGIIKTLTIKSGETKNLIGNTLMEVSETLKNQGITNISDETMDVLTNYMKKTTGLADNSIKKVKAFIYLGSEINSLKEKINKLNDKEKQKLLANSDIKGLLKNIEEDNSITSDLKRDIIESINTKLIDESLKELNKSDSALIDIKFQALISNLTVDGTAMEKIFSNVKEILPEKKSVETVKNFLNESFNATLDKGETAREAVKDNFKKAVDTASEALKKQVNSFFSFQIPAENSYLQEQEERKERKEKERQEKELAYEKARENIDLVPQQLDKVGRQFASIGNNILKSVQTYNESSEDLERYNLAADLVKIHYNKLIKLYGKKEVEEKIGRIDLNGNFQIAPYYPDNSNFNIPSLDLFRAFMFESQEQFEYGNILRRQWGEAYPTVKERGDFIREMNGRLWTEIRYTRDIREKFQNTNKRPGSLEPDRFKQKKKKRTGNFEPESFKEKQGLDKFFIESLEKNYDKLKEIYPSSTFKKYIGENKFPFKKPKLSIAEAVEIGKNSKESIHEFIKKPFTSKEIQNKINYHVLNAPIMYSRKHRERLKELRTWLNVFKDYEYSKNENEKKDIENKDWNWHKFDKKEVILN